MGKQGKHDVKSELMYDDIDEILDELGFDDEDDNEAEDSWRPKRKASKKRDARRRIEEYWDDRRLAEILNDYHYYDD